MTTEARTVIDIVFLFAFALVAGKILEAFVECIKLAAAAFAEKFSPRGKK